MTNSDKFVEGPGEKDKQENITIGKSVEVEEIEPTPPENEAPYVYPPTYKPQIPFLERLAKTNVEAQCRKFVELL